MRRSSAKQDQLSMMEKRGFFDPNVMHADGKLNMGVWDGDPTEISSWAAQGERIQAALGELLDKHQPEGAPWRIGLFVEADVPQQTSSERWVMLQQSIVDRWEWWSPQLQRQIGLITHEGCVAWPGRGAFEAHYVCFIPQGVYAAREAAKEKRVVDLLERPSMQDVGAGARAGDWKRDEQRIELPRKQALAALAED